MRARIFAAAAFALAMNANAADVGKVSKMVAPAPAAADDNPQWNRSGAYVGVIGAYDVAALQAEGIDASAGKLMAGGLAGYNFRAGPIVWGIEADWLFTGITASSGTEEVSVKASTQHLVSARMRFGVPMGPALLYVTAGPAWQHQRVSINGDGSSEWTLGAAMGGGAEVELSRSMFVRIEAIHYVFPADGFGSMEDFFRSDNQHTTARVALGFKLN